MRIEVASLTALLVSVLSSALAWGPLAHQAIGHVAQHFLTPLGERYVRHTLNRRESLASVGPWADGGQGERKGHSTSMHYVNVRTKAKEKCEYNDDRDCADGKCVVGAITKYTKLLLSEAELTAEEKNEALKFLTHFVADVTQPMHVCNRDDGGNKAPARFNGRKKQNMHKVWDTALPNLRVDDFGGSDEYYAEYLVDEIRSGRYRGLASLWISPYGVHDVNRNGNLRAAVDWASDTSMINCGMIWSKYDKNPTQDLSTDYFNVVSPIIDCQIAKAGYRLGDWINKVAESSS